MRSALGRAVVVLVLAAGLLALTAGQRWATAHVPASDLVGSGRGRDLGLTGSALSGGVSALAIAALASTAALLATGGKARRAVAAVIVAIGLGAVALCVYAVTSAGSTARTAASVRPLLRTGVTGSLPTSATAWPAVAVVAALAIAAGGALVLRAGGGRGLSARYEAPATAPAAAPAARTEADVEVDSWRAMDRGEDPTVSAEPGPA